MGKSDSRFIYVSLILASTTLLTGCSLISLASASAIDEGKPGTTVAIPGGLTNLPPKTKLFVLMKFDSLTQGRFKGVSPAPDVVPYSNYQYEYDQWRRQVGYKSCPLPSFGAGVQVVMNVDRPSDVTVGRFAGLDPGSMRLVTGRNGEITTLEIESVKEMYDSLRHVITREDFQRAYQDGVPLACGRMHYENANLLLEDHAAIPLADIQAVYMWRYSDARWDSFRMGLAIDVTAVVVGALFAAYYLNPGR
jgi:hypothetical protein